MKHCKLKQCKFFLELLSVFLKIFFRGAMGEVRLAFKKDSCERFAVKIISKSRFTPHIVSFRRRFVKFLSSFFPFFTKFVWNFSGYLETNLQRNKYFKIRQSCEFKIFPRFERFSNKF